SPVETPGTAVASSTSHDLLLVGHRTDRLLAGGRATAVDHEAAGREQRQVATNPCSYDRWSAWCQGALLSYAPLTLRLQPATAPSPAGRDRRRRWRGRIAALGAALLAGSLIAAPLAWSRSQPAATTPVASLVGARVYDWRSADQDVGPLQTQRVYHRQLPA